MIGLDRERAEARKPHQLFAGVRTFPLIALAGAVPMLMIDRTGPALVIGSFLAVVALALLSYYRTSTTGDVGATTEMAALSTFLLGVLAGAGQLVVAGASGVTIAVLLVAKPRLEAFSRALTSEELAATLELAVITIIILPLLPDQGYGPWGVLNPYDIGWIVVLVSTFSFAGVYVLILLLTESGREYFGTRGMYVAAALSAIADVDAVTIAFTRLGARSGQWQTPAGIVTTAIAVSTVVKLGIALILGAGRFRWQVASALTAMTLAGVLVGGLVFVKF